MNILDCPIREKLFNFAIAMQHTFGTDDELESDWKREIYKSLDKQTHLKCVDYLENYKYLLDDSPLVKGLFNMYIKAYEARTVKEIKAAYDDYMELQKQLPFENNIASYIEAGCIVDTPYLGNDDKLLLSYPIFLYEAYTQHGGKSADNRGGYLFPVHELSLDELNKIHKIAPELLEENKTIWKLYSNMKNKR